jgi:hypothetical protein
MSELRLYSCTLWISCNRSWAAPRSITHNWEWWCCHSSTSCVGQQQLAPTPNRGMFSTYVQLQQCSLLRWQLRCRRRCAGSALTKMLLLQLSVVVIAVVSLLTLRVCCHPAASSVKPSAGSSKQCGTQFAVSNTGIHQCLLLHPRTMHGCQRYCQYCMHYKQHPAFTAESCSLYFAPPFLMLCMHSLRHVLGFHSRHWGWLICAWLGGVHHPQ